MEGDQGIILQQFREITGVDNSRAQFYLESAGWNLELALAGFYEGDDGGEDIEVIENSPDPEEDDDLQVLHDTNLINEERLAQEFGGFPARNTAGASAEMSGNRRIATLFGSGSRKDDRNNSSDSEDERKDKGQAFYVGGSEKSGQQVLGPPRRKADSEDVIGKLFAKAKEMGAEEVGSSSQTPARSTGGSFTGAGRPLGFGGADEHQPTATNNPAAAAAGGTTTERTVTLRTWRNGFSVDDGPLRIYDDPASKAFMESIMQGQIPIEILREHPRMHINMEMENHQGEDFKPPKLKPFSGAGRQLGGIDAAAAANIANAAPIATPAQGNPAAAAATTTTTVPVAGLDESKPVTSVQLRLPDGSRLICKLNEGNTVNDLRLLVTNARPELGGRTFVLMTSFPTKELTDGSQSITAAGLSNATVMVKLK